MNSYQIRDRCSIRTVASFTLAAVLLLVVGCHTAEGVKQDTKSALDATGKGLQKGAAKIDGPKQDDSKQDVKKDAQSPK